MGSKRGAVLIGRSYRFSVLHFGQFCRHTSLSSVDYRAGNICNDNLSGIFIPSCFRRFSRWKNAKRPTYRTSYALYTSVFLPPCVPLRGGQKSVISVLRNPPLFSYFLSFFQNLIFPKFNISLFPKFNFPKIYWENYVSFSENLILVCS